MTTIAFKKNLLPFLGFISGAFSVICQWVIMLSKASANETSLVTETVRYYSYMTVWTNIMVTLCFGAVSVFAIHKWSAFFRRKSVQAATVVYILIVGLAYHFLLSGMFHPKGIEWFADFLLHYVNPIFFTGFWLWQGEKEPFDYVKAVQWLIFPAAYFMYSITRGFFTGWYPYYFVDVNTLGYGQVLVVSGFLMIGYAILGTLVIFSARKISGLKA